MRLGGRDEKRWVKDGLLLFRYSQPLARPLPSTYYIIRIYVAPSSSTSSGAAATVKNIFHSAIRSLAQSTSSDETCNGPNATLQNPGLCPYHPRPVNFPCRSACCCCCCTMLLDGILRRRAVVARTSRHYDLYV